MQDHNLFKKSQCKHAVVFEKGLCRFRSIGFVGNGFLKIRYVLYIIMVVEDDGLPEGIF